MARVAFPSLPRNLQAVYKRGQMLAHQDRVARLPVPPLQQTLTKYLTSVEPLLSAEELHQTRSVVAEFGKAGGLGERLQQKLLERAKTHENWLAKWRDSVAYLARRTPLVINASTCVSYPHQECRDRDAFVRTVVKHIMCQIKVSQLVFSESLPAEIYRNKPYCMSQYFKLFGCRIPGAKEDTVQRNYPYTTNHMIVMRKGRMYKMTILGINQDGEIDSVPPSYVIRELHKILDDATEPAEHPVGLLTTEHRDTWYRARQTLIQDPLNTANLHDMQNALFVTCLDEPHPHLLSAQQAGFVDTANTLVTNQCLHGNGTVFNTCNRWFDTTSQLVVGEDGSSGAMLEHSACDGTSAIFVSRFAMDMINHQKDFDLLADPHSSVNTSRLEPTRELKWNISSTTAQDIATAKANVDRKIHDIDLQVFSFREFGNNVPKSFDLSPDGFMQNAIQLAYYKMYRQPTAAYETGATRWFKYGRTDAIRSTTNAALAFTRTMCDPQASNETKVNALVEAVKAHSQYTAEAVSGQAVDRHLLGLRMLALEAGMEVPELYKDVAYVRSLHFCLSTSQVPCPDDDIFIGFGAVVPDGYGVFYTPRQDKFLISVSSYRSCLTTDSMAFGDKLKESLGEMRSMLVATRGLRTKI